MRMKCKCNILLFVLFPFLFSCSVSKEISNSANSILLKDSILQHAHIGISIYDPSTGKYLYQHEADKYFVPASNAKLFTLYAGMKYLGDSLPGLRYQSRNDSSIYIYATGDPTFLHPVFPNQRIYDFLKAKKYIQVKQWGSINPYGPGWAWEDQQEEYMVPKTAFPIYSNLLTITWQGENKLRFEPPYFETKTFSGDTMIKGFQVVKKFGVNDYQVYPGNKQKDVVPFYTDYSTIASLLKDTLPQNASVTFSNSKILKKEGLTTIYSQPVDSVFKFMMFTSDNFFAEQTLLMVSNEKFGFMDDSIIDTILTSDFLDIPDKPRWVDGSGLSRYNLFSPNDFVYILQKLEHDFGWKRILSILPPGNKGTLKTHFSSEDSAIHAKTGSMGNIYAISGYLHTKKRKQLIFSIIINNYIGNSPKTRIQVEHFIQQMIIKN